ncbi:3-keto-5-aminohexanoate cleavage protein [Streptomyces sp. NPDC004111]|uniref:3-keto-5-aminohexanoate cleavage protein n=1 Tax=Streptomyces sp. NPDC004111 TaxID=3364690 RepID=UPI0036AEE982
MVEPLIQVCLNGQRGPGDGAAVPVSPDAMAEAAAAAVAAGAGEVHVHPKTPCGDDTLSPRALAATLTAIRDAVDVPVGVTTGAWTEPEPHRRVERIESWTVLPDHASVNWHEPGAEEVAHALLARGVEIESGLWSGTDGVKKFLCSPLADRSLRVLVEVTDPDPLTAEDSALQFLAELARCGGVGAKGDVRGAPMLLHGEGGGAWPVLALARRLGLATRIGLEDTLLLPDGAPAASNAQLVAAARKIKWPVEGA